MMDASGAWDGARVRAWLASRVDAARLEQARADRRGYDAADDYDVAAAEEFACRALQTGAHAAGQAAFAAHVKALLAQDEYQVTGIHDDHRFDRAVRSHLKKIAKMTKANEGFANTLRHQG